MIDVCLWNCEKVFGGEGASFCEQAFWMQSTQQCAEIGGRHVCGRQKNCANEKES